MRRFPVAVAALVVFCLAAAASAQTARALGTIRDQSGRPIKGATIVALNAEAYPAQITSVSDERGRWAMIGLRTGLWRFIVQAEGYVPVDSSAQVRVGNTAPMSVTMARDPGPVPNALERDIQQQLTKAAALRDQGQLDQALAAYEGIRDRNPRLTSVNLAVAGLYRLKATRQDDASQRRLLLEQAIKSYTIALDADSGNERARAELASVRAEVEAIR